MSKSGSHELVVSTLSDDYIRDLQSENQRYDITLAQDFVISVLPNGIKTWAFIYDFQGRNRRRTLGVFPDMTFEEAKVALKKARQVMIRMDEPTVPPDDLGTRPAVLGGGHYIPKNKPEKSRKLKIILAAAALLAILVFSAVTWLPFGDSQQGPADSVKFDSAQPFATKPKQPEPTPTVPPDTPIRSQESDRGSRAKSGSPSPDPKTETTPRATESRNTPAPAKTSPKKSPPSVNSKPDTPKTNIVGQQKATALGGSVSRSRLTSQVKNLEPVDEIGPEVSYKDTGYTRVFYFTELREFSDGSVLHRWERNGELEEEVYLKVKKSWRWRTFSNKDIPSGLTGEWKVMTIDATGNILDSKTFTYGY